MLTALSNPHPHCCSHPFGIIQHSAAPHSVVYGSLSNMQQQQKVVKVNGEMVNDGVVGCEEAHEGEGR
jgi:hypothetical protein